MNENEKLNEYYSVINTKKNSPIPPFFFFLFCEFASEWQDALAFNKFLRYFPCSFYFISLLSLLSPSLSLYVFFLFRSFFIFFIELSINHVIDNLSGQAWMLCNAFTTVQYVNFFFYFTTASIVRPLVFQNFFDSKLHRR